MLTAIMTEVLYEHAIQSGAIPREERALIRKKRGCTDALLVDGMAMGEARDSKRSISVGWIDYQKAFNRVPHKWLIDMLKIIKAPKEIVKVVKQIVSIWRTTFTVTTDADPITFKIKLKRGAFQGDSLSPLLFCLAISPVAKAMRETKGYYCQAMRQKLTHLFFVDDLKVYAGNSKELTEALKIVQDSSKAVGMALGLAKCGVAHMKRGKVGVKGDEILQSEGLIPEITSDKLY